MWSRLLIGHSDFPIRRSGDACDSGGRPSPRQRRTGGPTTFRVFGSVARGEDTEASDVDLLVDLDQGVGLLDLIGLARELGELLGVDVDVVPADMLSPNARPRPSGGGPPVSRRDEERLADVLASAEAIASHLERGGLDDGLVVGSVVRTPAELVSDVVDQR